MSKDLSIAQKIRALKPASGFVVKTPAERQEASKIGKALKDSGAVSFDVITKKRGAGFIVAAI